MTRKGRIRPGGTRLANLVAERAGVSLMTVSRVFNDSPRVADKTRAKVLQIAREVGYEPSSAARSLRRGRSNLIGYLLESTAGIRGHFHSDALAALESVVSDEGYMISLVAPPKGQSLLETIRLLIASRSCAAFVARFDHFKEEDFAGLAIAQVPIVIASNAPEQMQHDSPFSTVCFDNVRGCLQAIRYLHTLGHRRIAFFNGDKGWIDSNQREQGYRQGMAEVGLKVDESLIRYCVYGNALATSARAFDEVMASGAEPPTAVFCASDEIAAGGIAAARRWGKRVPEEVSFIGYDDAYWCRFVSPQLTTVRHDGFDLGLKMGEILMKELEEEERTPQHVVLETCLVVRDSVAPAPRA